MPGLCRDLADGDERVAIGGRDDEIVSLGRHERLRARHQRVAVAHIELTGELERDRPSRRPTEWSPALGT